MTKTDPQTLLLLLQFGCFIITLMLALLLAYARIHTRLIVRRYETSRWLLFTAMMLYAVHYALQMVCGFRAQGDDVGAVVNTLFYTPITYLLSYAIVNLIGRSRHLKFYLTTSCVCFVLIIVCFAIGQMTYHSLHMPVASNIMGGLFAMGTIVAIYHPLREMQHAQRQIENETADDLSGFNLFMKTSTLLLMVMGAFVPIFIFSINILYIVGPLFMLALFFYIVSFVALGFNISSVSDYIENEDCCSNTAPLSESRTSHLSPLASSRKAESGVYADPCRSEGLGHPLEEGGVDAEPGRSEHKPDHTETLEEAIAKWRTRRGFSVTHLGINALAEQLGVTKRELAEYIARVHGTTFRVWLSNVRIEEVKRMLIEHENYSNESIAEECGFSSRSWMQEKFKAQTGLTPSEWRAAMKHEQAPQPDDSRLD